MTEGTNPELDFDRQAAGFGEGRIGAPARPQQPTVGDPVPAGTLPDPAEPQPLPARRPYVRPQAPHRTVEPVDDLQQDDAMADYSHDSEFTVGAHSPLPGRGYRRSRNEMPQLRHDLQYGQYLSVPKGRRDIFASRERKRRARSAVVAIAVIALLAIVAVVVWRLMPH